LPRTILPDVLVSGWGDSSVVALVTLVQSS
jgi:hypothetical protein